MGAPAAGAAVRDLSGLVGQDPAAPACRLKGWPISSPARLPTACVGRQNQPSPDYLVPGDPLDKPKYCALPLVDDRLVLDVTAIAPAPPQMRKSNVRR